MQHKFCLTQNLLARVKWRPRDCAGHWARGPLLRGPPLGHTVLGFDDFTHSPMGSWPTRLFSRPLRFPPGPPCPVQSHLGTALHQRQDLPRGQTSGILQGLWPGGPPQPLPRQTEGQLTQGPRPNPATCCSALRFPIEPPGGAIIGTWRRRPRKASGHAYQWSYPGKWLVLQRNKPKPSQPCPSRLPSLV